MKKSLYITTLSLSLICNFVALYYAAKLYLGDKRTIPFIKSKIVFVGDSRLAEINWRKKMGRMDVISGAISGTTSGHLKDKIDSILDGRSPRYVVVQSGINDLRASVPLDSIVDNYNHIVKVLADKRITPVILSVIPLRKDFAQDKVPEDVINENAARLNARIAELARQRNAMFLDVTAKISTDKRLDREYTYDGIHLNELGQQVVAETIDQNLSI